MATPILVTIIESSNIIISCSLSFSSLSLLGTTKNPLTLVISYNIDLRSAYHFHVRLHRIFRQIHHLHVEIIPNDCLFWQFLSENDFILNISNSHSRLNGSAQSTFHNLRSISQFFWKTLLVPKTHLALWEKSYILALISCDCACISTISISNVCMYIVHCTMYSVHPSYQKNMRVWPWFHPPFNSYLVKNNFSASESIVVYSPPYHRIHRFCNFSCRADERGTPFNPVSRDP